MKDAVVVQGSTSLFQSEDSCSTQDNRSIPVTDGVCYQRKVKEARRGSGWSPNDNSLSNAEFTEIPFRLAKQFIVQYEWLGTMPSGFRKAYGLLWGGNLGCCCVFGSPNPMQIARSVFGGKHMDRVMQLHRGASTWWAHQHSASNLIGRCIRTLKKDGWGAVVAFSDPQAGEIGTVYQATNWKCCGLTAKRPDYYDASGKRKVGVFQVAGMTRQPRPRKYRYLYLLDESLRKDLKWESVSYPKRGAIIFSATSEPTGGRSSRRRRLKP